MIVRDLGATPYVQTLERMRAFTARRTRLRFDGHTAGPAPADEIWLTEHPPVFTLGLDGNTAHLLDPGDIPVLATERGGQVTYHGPGQAIAYLLLDLRARRLGVRDLVCRIEAGVIDCLATCGIAAIRRPGAPGLYVARPPATPGSGPGWAKIASIGLKISHGFSYHGVAVNGHMDLAPFQRIDPCGFPGLEMTDVFTEASADFLVEMPGLAARLGHSLVGALER